MGCGSSNSNEVVENNIQPPENIVNKQTITQKPNLEKAPEIKIPNQNMNNIPNMNTEKNTLENTSKNNQMNEEEKKGETNQNELLQKEEKNEIKFDLKFENKVETKKEKEMYDKPRNKNSNIKYKVNKGKNNNQFTYSNNQFTYSNNQVNIKIRNTTNNNINLGNMNFDNLMGGIDNYVNNQINYAFNLINQDMGGIGINNRNYNINMNINDSNYDGDNVKNYDDYNDYNDENQQFDYGQNEEKSQLTEEERKKWEEEQEIKRKEEEKRRKEEEERRKKEEEEERRKKEEEERRKKEEEERIKKEKELKRKERKYNTLEEFLKFEEERLKKEEEEILFQHRTKIDLYRKAEEEKQKQELKEKEESDNDQQRWKKNQKLGVKFRTSKEIKDFAKDVMSLYNIPTKYEINPKTTSPYNSGKITKETYDNSLKYLNSLRFAAGLTYDIGLTDKYNQLAQDASLLCQVNNKLAHTNQPKPKNMDKKLYNSGAKGCAESNLGMGHNNLLDSLKGWVSDQDSGNFDRMGHRRWVLNPTMKNTGLGLVKNYSAMYSFDCEAEENNVKNVAWPCQHMPIEFFGDNYPWTLTTNENLDKKVTVTITNKKTKQETKFNNYINNKFLVNNDGYGQTGCVIFRPYFKYSEGDSFRVDVNCTKFSVSYDVSFFHIECTHKKEVLGSVKSSCMVKGKKILFCDKCGLFNEPLELEPHDEDVKSYDKANCLKKGRKVFECLTCCQQFDNEIGIQPHDYTFRNISTYKVEGTCKDCNKKININPPTTFNLWWSTLDKPDNYSSAVPDYNPIDSTILVWVEGVNGDKGYKEIIFEVDNPSLLKLPEKIENEPNNQLKVLGAGSVQLTIYPKYNPNLKQYANIELG